MDYAKLLTRGVGAWLQFEQACDRSGVFSEKYLANPVGQILNARAEGRILAEYKHSVLAPLKSGPGRRPEIDFVVLNDRGEVSVAIETKWIGRSKPTVLKVFWDLIRLELLAHHHNARCFFIMGGKRSELEKYFQAEPFAGCSPNGQRRPLLRSDLNSLHKTKLVPHENPRVEILKELFQPYLDLDLQFPQTIISRRSEPFPPNQLKKYFQVYAWEIKSAPNREVFRPRNSRHFI